MSSRLEGKAVRRRRTPWEGGPTQPSSRLDATRRDGTTFDIYRESQVTPDIFPSAKPSAAKKVVESRLLDFSDSLYMGLAAQKHHYALYLMAVYMDPDGFDQLREAFEAEGKPFDMGKSCLRFKRLEDLPLPVIERLVAATSVDAFIAYYEATRGKS